MSTALSCHDGDALPPAGVMYPRHQLALHGRDAPRRAEVEAFIRSAFSRRYGADVRHFAPTLVSLQDRGEIVAAAGYRSAADEPLFLESYLSAPIEQLLVSPPEAQPLRRTVVEVGNLAASRAGEGRRLIGLLGPHLLAEGFQWVAGTFTAELRHLFVRLGVTPRALGTANPAALGHDTSHWGTYYEHHPLVVAGHLGQALGHMARRTSHQKGRP